MLTAKVQRFLDELYIKYVLHTNVKTDSTSEFAAYAKSIGAHAIKVVLFSDNRGPLLVAYDAKDALDFEALFKATDRKLGLDSGHNYKYQLNGFSIRHLPPFGRFFQMQMVMDEKLLHHKSYLLEISKGDSFLEIDEKSFKTLFSHASIKAFARKVSSANLATNAASAALAIKKQKVVGPLLSEKSVEEQFASGIQLPVVPNVAKQLLAMRSQDNVDIEKLVYVIRTDPVISAKIISYAQSPYFAYQGKLGSLHEAIFHVLGVDLTINTALAMSLGQEFKGPIDGPFGAKNVWRHSVYCAILTQSIATSISQRHKVNPNAAYLYGLLHNIGFLALGHLYSKRFTLFNRAVEAKRHLPVELIESKLLGISHTRVGELLMDSWNMPTAYKNVVLNHHDAEYKGDEEIYVHLIYLANSLLKTIDLGDAKFGGIPEQILKHYQINEGEIQNMLEIVMGWHDNLDNLAQQLAA